MRKRTSYLLLIVLMCGCTSRVREVQLHEFEPAFRNPMKGLREWFDPGQTKIREEYPEPFGSMIKEYMQWNKMENVESDGVDKVIAYSNHRWKGVEDINMKVIPRPYIIWLEPWHGGKPSDPRYPDDMDGWFWPSDIPGETGPYKQIPGSVGAYVDPADSLTPIVGGYFDPSFPERVEKFVAKLGEAWDNDPRVAYVEMGIIGEWGEHHDPDITTFWPPHDEPVHVANRTWLPGIDKVLGDAFTKYFKNKKVMVRYAYDFPDYEFGIYWDSWSIDQEIERGYNQMRALGDRWKTQVIGGEITWGWGSLAIKKLKGFPGCIADPETHQLMIEQIRNLHCNHLGGVTWTNFQDPKVMADVQDIQKALGYRYVIGKARYGARIKTGKPWKLSFDVTNTGSSPFYYPWPVQVALLDPKTHAPIWTSVLEDVDICKWLPGDNYDVAAGRYLDAPKKNRVTASLKVEDVPEGEYIVGLTILDPAGMLPSVRFANVEAFEGGYTILGSVGVGCNAAPLAEQDWFDLRDERSLHYIVPKAAAPVYKDASAFPVYGKAFAGDGPRYRRLPKELEGVVREPLWNLGCCSAGLYLRFRSNAPEIYARWSNTAFHMPHMPDCGVGGLDLYTRIDGEWRFVGSGFNWGEIRKDHESRLVGNMEPKMREYMLYLGLYDEITSLQIGVPEGYALEEPVLCSPQNDNPVVMYGTSILQGGCCSRPGMAHTNILSRHLDRTVINLGFSGNALLDPEIAELMASVPNPAVFVLDYAPNSIGPHIRENGENFFRILRDAHPDVPVIFVENPIYPHSAVDNVERQMILDKNAAQLELFRKLKASGEKRLYYVPADKLLGSDAEACVDGVHFTDLGMMRYAACLEPVIKSALRYSK